MTKSNPTLGKQLMDFIEAEDVVYRNWHDEIWMPDAETKLNEFLDKVIDKAVQEQLREADFHTYDTSVNP